ncbi:hypothetical protein [Pseudomonas sp. S1(2024)]|uniref:hypothetical protein n=1 Tax=Pseudomonas sp. S1(2024) TaxID=3390191 RepID=UPI00397AEFD4
MKAADNDPLVPLKNLLHSRAEKAALALEPDDGIGPIMCKLVEAGIKLDADKPVANAWAKILGSVPAIHALLREGASPYWASAAKVESRFGEPLILGHHPGIASSASARSMVLALGMLQSTSTLATNEHMVASNLLRMMLLGVITPYHVATDQISPRWKQLLCQPAVQLTIADELTRQPGGQALLDKPENVLKMGVMFQQLGAQTVVEALQDHPLAQALFTPNVIRDGAVTNLVILSLDLPDADKVAQVHEAVARFLGIEALDEIFDQAFAHACQTPMTNEGTGVARRVLSLRLANLSQLGVGSQAQPWLAQAAAFPLDSADPESQFHLQPFWLELARYPELMQGPTRFLQRLTDSSFLKGTLDTMGENAWAQIFSAAWGTDAAQSSHLEVLTRLNAQELASYPVLRKAMLGVIEREIVRPEASLAFLQKDDLDKIWDGYRNAAVKICSMVGLYLAPDYCTEAAAAWFDLLKHAICQQAMIAKLPRDPVLLAKLDDAGLESALSGDLGL